MNLRFGSSGIRGKYPETVNPAVAFELGKLLPKTLGGTVALGRDPRHSGQVLKAAFVASALQSGARVLDYDMVPTPAIAYETKFHRASAGVVITASHNPPEYNGFKIFDSTGEALKDERSLFKAKVHGAKPLGKTPFAGVVQNRQPHSYVDMITQIRLERKWRVVLDPGNGAASLLGPRVYRELLGGVTSINSVPDGSFTARGSEPTEKSEKTLSATVVETRADAGIAFDGDGDRMFIVDEKGNRPLQDRVLASYISFLSRRSKGPFLVPLDASMAIDEVAEQHGARLVRGPVGDALLLQEMKKCGAKFAGEPSGAWIHYDHNSTPDGILSGLLFLKSVEEMGGPVSKGIEAVPQYSMIRHSVRYPPRLTRTKVESLARGLRRVLGTDSSTSIRFGLRVSTEQSWILVRESGTEPVIRVTGESKKSSEGLRVMRESLRLLRRVLKSRH